MKTALKELIGISLALAFLVACQPDSAPVRIPANTPISNTCTPSTMLCPAAFI